MKAFFAALLAVATCSLVAQERNPRDWARVILKNSVDAQPRIRMKGTRAVEELGGPQAIRYQDFVLRDGLRVRITYPESSQRYGQILVETPEARLEWIPSENLIRRMKGNRLGGGAILHRLAELARAGDAKVREFAAQPIAGRRAYGVAAHSPRGTVALKLHIDAETGLILKSEHFAPDGARRGGFEFTSVEFDPQIPDGAFVLRKPGARIVDVPDSDAPEARVPWRVLIPGHLPAGMEEVQRQVREMQGRKVLMIHYRGGRFNMTLFQAPGDHAPPRPEIGDRLNYVTRKVGDIWLVLVGNMPPEMLNRILSSVRPANEPSHL